MDEFRKAIARMPSRLDLRIALIRLLEEQGYIEEAIKEYREILARTPEAVDIRLDLASAMDRGGLIREVIEEYARVLELDPRNAFAFKKHASLLREREKIDLLTDRYLGYVINRMEKIGDHFREGMKMYLDGCFDDALGEFVAEATEAPSPEAHFGTGACMVRAGSLLTAVPQFREAIKLKSDLKEAHTMLGILYERHGLLYEASEEYELGVKEALDRIKSGEELKRKVDLRASEPSFRFFQLFEHARHEGTEATEVRFVTPFKHQINMGNLLLLISLVPLAFLIYTLLNLDALNISLTHPRVIVESALFLAFLFAGIYLKTRKSD